MMSRWHLAASNRYLILQLSSEFRLEIRHAEEIASSDSVSQSFLDGVTVEHKSKL